MRRAPAPTRASVLHAVTEEILARRDGQLPTLIMNEGGIDPGKLTAVLHYDGTPITARFIAGEIAAHMGAARQPTYTEAAE